MQNNLVEIFFQAAKQYPENIAIVYKGKQVTYRELDEQVQSSMDYFSKKGIRKGDRILVFVPMSIALYKTVLALFGLGATVVFVDEWSDKSRLRKALQVVDVHAIVAPKKYIWLAYLISPFRNISKKISVPPNLSFTKHDITPVDPMDTALITFTTGSTGLPKAANRTHHFLSEQFRILKDEIRALPTDKCLVTLPIVLLSIMGTGATSFIANFNQKKPELLDVHSQINQMIDQSISILISSPYFIEKLAEKPSNSFQNIRKVITGGAPVFPHLASLINQSFTSSENIVAYGSTEAEPIATVDMRSLEAQIDIQTKGLLVGKIHPEISLKIIKITDDVISLSKHNWSEIELNEGEIGEIVVSGPHVLDSYYNSPDSFLLNKIDDQGKIWHRTGDSGIYIDGLLYLHGRCNQLITYQEKTISGFICEYSIQQIDGVNMGTIIHARDKLIMCIEVSNPTRIPQIKEQLLNLGYPIDRIEFLEKIPRDPRHFSKIDYHKLIDLMN